MIKCFEKTAIDHADQVFFRFRQPETDGAWSECCVSYADARLRAGKVLDGLTRSGLETGGYVACDMENCPSFVFLFLACMYGGFTLVTLNHRLTEEEKAARLAALSQDARIPSIQSFDEARLKSLIDECSRSNDQLSHMLHHAAGVVSETRQGVVMFTSGTTGKPKAARLTGSNLKGSALSCNAVLGADAFTVWQASLPLYHVGGLQIVVRSMLNANPFILYRRFDASVVRRDADRCAATHVSVVDKTLRELLQLGKCPYKAMLLGGAKPNSATLELAIERGACVFSGYGMTETSSMMAYCLVRDSSDQGLSLLPGYEARIMSPDAQGVGQLAVKGPGVFDGYVGAVTSRAADGFFLTGDRACIRDRRIVIAERVGDMFVSGGENVYPEEIRQKILAIPGVTDAYVFGAPDPEWGRRPVAMVEMANTEVDGSNAALLASQVRASLKQRLARIYQPDRVFVMGQFDRVGIGKIDRKTLAARAECAVDVRKVELFRIRLPLQHPIRTAKITMTQRESIIVRVTDSHGQTGISECVAFETPWYLPETLDSCLGYLEKQVIPSVLKNAFLRPDEVHSAFMGLPGAKDHSLARGAIEPALWDLYGRNMGCSLATLIGAKERFDIRGSSEQLPGGVVPGGVVLGLASLPETLASAKLAVDRGYRRIKMKIAPGNDIVRVRAVREAFPDTMLLLDANQSYTEKDEAVLRTLDSLGCACIEEPLDPRFVPESGPRDLFSRLARLQRCMSTPIALDESWVTMDDALEALRHPDLRCLVLKVAKCGGVMPAVELYWRARAHGATVWMGGMYDTGVSKRLHAAFSLLPGVTIPGDISDTSYYFDTDVTHPAFALDHGLMPVNPQGYPNGLGCDLDEEQLSRVTIDRRVYQ